MSDALPPFAREETCTCGARLRIENRLEVPGDSWFRSWRREHGCPPEEDA